jgi:hypothetical protein
MGSRRRTIRRVQSPIQNTCLPDASTRPTRIAVTGQILITLLLLASFVSGVMVWWGKKSQLEEAFAPSWLHTMLIVHGSLNPFLCVLFGYLLCHHIRFGWRMRANMVSGFIMEAAFAGLILTGAGLYYAGSEEWRAKIMMAHHILGVLLPLGLGGHWIMGLVWANKQVTPETPDRSLSGG